MTRRVAALMAGGLLQAATAVAADPSVMRVAVVPSAGQMSLVVEMSDEARRVSTQQVTPTLLLVEAGPIALPVKRQILNAPSGLSLLQKVSLDEGTTPANEHVLHLAVNMKRSAPSTVRVVGRRIYIDFAVPDAATLPAASTRAAPLSKRTEENAANTRQRVPENVSSRQALSGATSRLDEIEPFLLSATSAPVPNPAVLNAVGEAITSVQQSLRAMQAPAQAAPPYQLLVSAASLAAEAVNPAFRGDRASKAKQSMAVFAAAKAQLQ